MQISDFLGQLQTAVFPDSLTAAQKCTTAEEITQWKQQHIQKIMTMRVVGELGTDGVQE